MVESVNDDFHLGFGEQKKAMIRLKSISRTGHFPQASSIY